MEFTPDISHARVLTDDLNPIDLRAQAINLVARQDLHQYFQQGGMNW
ncbi:MAG: hypothetical protein HYR76_11240 [Ignavibacteria bacterium]|nr:hypothetical protein [Ignavibacteria bacterium]